MGTEVTPETSRRVNSRKRTLSTIALARCQQIHKGNDTDMSS